MAAVRKPTASNGRNDPRFGILITPSDSYAPAASMTGTEIIGPAPCFFNRVNNVFRWHLLLRGPDPATALRGMDIARGWYVDVDPVDVL